MVLLCCIFPLQAGILHNSPGWLSYPYFLAKRSQLLQAVPSYCCPVGVCVYLCLALQGLTLLPGHCHSKSWGTASSLSISPVPSSLHVFLVLSCCCSSLHRENSELYTSLHPSTGFFRTSILTRTKKKKILAWLLTKVQVAYQGKLATGKNPLPAGWGTPCFPSSSSGCYNLFSSMSL